LLWLLEQPVLAFGMTRSILRETDSGRMSAMGGKRAVGSRFYAPVASIQLAMYFNLC
jgi:hypothetical protein